MVYSSDGLLFWWFAILMICFSDGFLFWLFAFLMVWFSDDLSFCWFTFVMVCFSDDLLFWWFAFLMVYFCDGSLFWWFSDCSDAGFFYGLLLVKVEAWQNSCRIFLFFLFFVFLLQKIRITRFCIFFWWIIKNVLKVWALQNFHSQIFKANLNSQSSFHFSYVHMNLLFNIRLM